MATYNYNDSMTVQRYLEEITTFILAIVQDENLAIVLACQVFEEHQKRQDSNPFISEEDRLRWLQLRGRDLSLDHLRHERNKEIKARAVGAAIHDSP